MLAEQAVLLVEWPQRGDGWLPPADLRVDIAHAGDNRRVRIGAESGEGRKMLSRLSIQDLA